ncbi:MAG: putative signal transducing protein [Planctomycetota bacterium JB042]
MVDGDPVEVYVARDASDAAMALAMLAAEGIEGRVVGENLQTAAGELGMSYNALPRVWVPGEQAGRARELIRAHERERSAPADAAPAAPWVCPGCGESVPGEFDLCWSCQTERP